MDLKLLRGGLRVATGSPGFDDGGNDLDNYGRARVFDYNGAAWIQVGQDIVGPTAGDGVGGVVGLSDRPRGNRGFLRPAGIRGDAEAFPKPPRGIAATTPRVFLSSPGVASTHHQLGVRAGNAGTRIVVGLEENDFPTSCDSGRVRVYDLDRNGVWVQHGASFDDDHRHGVGGRSVAISGDGGTVASGNSNPAAIGTVQAYDLC